METYFHNDFKKQYKKYRALQSKIDKRLILFRADPYHPILNNHPLTGKYRGYRSINITGDYRAVYEPLGKDASLFVDLDTHSNLYK